MSTGSEKITVHTRKFYRVVLEGIDSKQETPESFAIKLSMRTRTTLPRVKQVIRNLPYTVKSGLTAGQANRLRAVLEEIGGLARVETHFVTPEEHGASSASPSSEASQLASGTESKMTCPQCGWEEPSGATHCSLCLRRFRDEDKRSKSLGARLPGENPLESETFRPPDGPAEPRGVDWVALWQRHKLPILIGAAVLVLLILLVK